MTGNYLHHDDYGPDYVCDVYHNECVTCSGFDFNTPDNSYHLSPQCILEDQDYEALHPYLLWLPIECVKHTLATTTQWFCNAYCINTLNPTSQLPMFPIAMSLLLLTLCSLMSLC